MKSGFSAAGAGYIITEGGKTHTLEQKHSIHFKLPDVAGLKLSRAASPGPELVSEKTLFQTALLQASSCLLPVRTCGPSAQYHHRHTRHTGVLHRTYISLLQPQCITHFMPLLLQTSLSPGLYFEMILSSFTQPVPTG